MPLTHLHVLNVCKLSTTQQCKYLHEDELERDVFHCLKLSSQRKYVEDLQNSNGSHLYQGTQPYTDFSKNDNCAGYPLLRSLEVGYDKKHLDS